jgi:uncharacterized protein YodC (DUF2158 family)
VASRHIAPPTASPRRMCASSSLPSALAQERVRATASPAQAPTAPAVAKAPRVATAPPPERAVPVAQRTDHATPDIDPVAINSAKFKIGQQVQLVKSGFTGVVTDYRATSGSKQLRYAIAFDGYSAQRAEDPIGYAEDAICAYDPAQCCRTSH